MTSTSGLSFSGLYSGLDTELIISQLMLIERQPVTLLQQKQYKLEYQKTKLNEVNTSVLAVKTAISSFASGLAFSSSLSSTNESVATGSSTTAASDGTYLLTVANLAQQQVYASGQKASTWTSQNPGGISITHADTGYTFNIDTSGKTLSQIKDAINSSNDGSGHNFTSYGVAQIITDPASGNQVLTIKSLETGLDNAFTYADTTAGTMADLGMYESQAALDANFTLNGVSLSSTTDTVSSAITGVTLELQGTGSSTIKIGVSDDDIVSNISSFIEKFNSATDLISGYVNEEKNDDPSSQEDFSAGVLHGDYDLINCKSQMRIRTTGYIDSSLSKYVSLASIGISSEASSGSYVSSNIEFDEEAFRAALAEDPTEVQSLLEGWASQMDDYLEATTEVSVSQTLAGTFYSRILSIDDQIDNIDTELDDWDDKLTQIEERYRTQFSEMEEALSSLSTQSSYLTSQLASLTSSSD